MRKQRKLQEQKHEYSGDHRDYLNSSAFLFVGLFTLLNEILKGRDLISRSYLTLTFFILAFLMYNKKTSKLIKSIVFILSGIVYQVFSIPDSSYIGASVFFILAFLQYDNIKHGISLSLVSLISIAIKSTITGDTPSQLITSISIFILLYGNAYLIIKEYKKKIANLQKKLREKRKDRPVIRNIDIIKVSEQDKAVIKMYLNGYDYAKISKFLAIDIKKESIRQKITRIRRTTNCENDMQFAIWLTDIV